MTEPTLGGFAARFLVVLLIVGANALFVAAEFALVAARRTRIDAMIRRGDAKARVVRRTSGRPGGKEAWPVQHRFADVS